MKRNIRKQLPFDVAILGCGAYGLPLVNFIVHELKRPAVYIGGGVQILFGIKGRRWLSHPVISTFFNDNWVFPSDNEKPSGADQVEGSSYWN